MVIRRISKFNVNIVLLMAIIAWYIVPTVSDRLGTIGLLGVTFLWVMTSNLSLFIHSLRAMSFFFLWYFYMLLMLAFGLYNSSGVTPIYFFTMTVVTVFPAALLNYYMQPGNSVNYLWIKRYICVLYLYVAVRTVSVLLIYPTAAKILAMGDAVAEEKNLFTSMGCGGYGFIYSLVLIIVPMLFSNEKSNFWRIVDIAAAIICLATMILSQYALALIIVLGGITVMYFLPNHEESRNQFALKIVILLGAMLLLFNIVGILTAAADMLADTTKGLSTRLYEIVDYLTTGNQGYNMGSRTDLYGLSWGLFLKHPIFGNQWFDSTTVYGGHSAFLDQLARYGLFGFSGYLAFIVSSRKRTSWYFDRKAIWVEYILFVVLSFLNNTMFIYQVGFALFFAVPMFCKQNTDGWQEWLE